MTGAKEGLAKLTGMTGKEKRDAITKYLDERGDDTLFADGLDDAIVGLGRQFDKFLVIYDFDECIRVFIKGGMKENEAVEYFEFNTLGAYVGELTPIFMNLPNNLE